MHDFDAVVVGAGFSGVAAARELCRNGQSVIILEARNRIGGRTFREKFAGIDIEGGGTYVHWMQPFVWGEIMRHGLKIEESMGCADPQFCSFLCDGKLRKIAPEKLEAMLERSMTKFCESGRTLLRRPYDLDTFDDATNPGIAALDALSCFELIASLGLNLEERDALDSFIQGLSSCSTKEVGALSVLRCAALVNFDLGLLFETTSQFSLSDGTESLLRAILGECTLHGASSGLAGPIPAPVRFGRVVSHVTQEKGGTCSVTCTNGESVSARSVVIAVPWNVLSSGSMSFSPPLPRNMADAIAGGHAGRGLKLYIRTPGKLEDFYAMATVAFSVPGTAEPVLIDYLQTVKYLPASDSTLLVGFGPDRTMLPSHAHLTGEKDLATIQSAVDRLWPASGTTSSPKVLEAHSYNWVEDRFARGTWTAARPGAVTAGKLRAMSEVFGSITFAGADFGLGWFGCIDGAIESGISAGRRASKVIVKGGSQQRGKI